MVMINCFDISNDNKARFMNALLKNKHHLSFVGIYKWKIYSLQYEFKVFISCKFSHKNPYDVISRLMKVMPLENISIKTFQNAEDVCVFDEHTNS